VSPSRPTAARRSPALSPPSASRPSSSTSSARAVRPFSLPLWAVERVLTVALTLPLSPSSCSPPFAVPPRRPRCRRPRPTRPSSPTFPRLPLSPPLYAHPHLRIMRSSPTLDTRTRRRRRPNSRPRRQARRRPSRSRASTRRRPTRCSGSRGVIRIRASALARTLGRVRSSFCETGATRDPGGAEPAGGPPRRLLVALAPLSSLSTSRDVTDVFFGPARRPGHALSAPNVSASSKSSPSPSPPLGALPLALASPSYLSVVPPHPLPLPSSSARCRS